MNGADIWGEPIPLPRRPGMNAGPMTGSAGKRPEGLWGNAWGNPPLLPLRPAGAEALQGGGRHLHDFRVLDLAADRQGLLQQPPGLLRLP